LFDRAPHAFGKVEQWAAVVRGVPEARGVLSAGVSCLHDKRADTKAFTQYLPLIEAAATDERNFVKKAVSWALRAIGGRNAELKSAAVALARRLSSAADSTSRWVGRDALRSL
jgi:3-methyladenine DNA glycosylase AlkD